MIFFRKINNCQNCWFFNRLEFEIVTKTMITDYKKIQHSALELDENHRAKLAKKLIDSLDKQIDDDIEQAWVDEIKVRKAEIQSGKVSPISGQEVHEAAREFLKK